MYSKILQEAHPKLVLDPATVASLIPDNPTIRILAFAIAMAHFVFGDTSAVVLFVVQPGERNVSIGCRLLSWTCNVLVEAAIHHDVPNYLWGSY